MSFCSRYLLEESLRRSDILRGSAMASCSGLPSKVTSPSVGGHHAGEASFPYVALILPSDRAETVIGNWGTRLKAMQVTDQRLSCRLVFRGDVKQICEAFGSATVTAFHDENASEVEARIPSEWAFQFKLNSRLYLESAVEVQDTTELQPATVDEECIVIFRGHHSNMTNGVRVLIDGRWALPVGAASMSLAEVCSAADEPPAKRVRIQ